MTVLGIPDDLSPHRFKGLADFSANSAFLLFTCKCYQDACDAPKASLCLSFL